MKIECAKEIRELEIAAGVADTFHGRNCCAALDRVQEFIEAHTWQPIETAKNGELLLFGCFHGGKWYVKIAKKGNGVSWRCVNIPVGFRDFSCATHWMPIPEPPNVEE